MWRQVTHDARFVLDQSWGVVLVALLLVALVGWRGGLGARAPATWSPRRRRLVRIAAFIGATTPLALLLLAIVWFRHDPDLAWKPEFRPVDLLPAVPPEVVVPRRVAITEAIAAAGLAAALLATVLGSGRRLRLATVVVVLPPLLFVESFVVCCALNGVWL